MAPPRFLPSESILKGWVEEGLTHQQIADRIEKETGYKVARSTVAAALSRAGLTQRVRYDDLIPWSPIRADHANAYPLVLLRLAARRQHGEVLTDEQNTRLDNWIERLERENAVVTYVWDSADGFVYVRRRPQDTGLIRILDGE